MNNVIVQFSVVLVLNPVAFVNLLLLGTHRVHVTVGDRTHPQSPLTFRVYDPDKIHIGGIKGGFVSETIEFSGKKKGALDF